MVLSRITRTTNPKQVTPITDTHSQVLEYEIIGSMMLDDECCKYGCEVVDPLWFYEERHRVIFRVIKSQGLGCSIITVTNALRDAKDLNRVGGPGYVSSICSMVAELSRFRHYVDQLKTYASRRRVQKIAADITGMLGMNRDVEGIISRVREGIKETADIGNGRVADTKGIVEALDARRAELANGGVAYIPTGFRHVDEVLSGGLPVGFPIVVKGDTGRGKSAFVLQVLDQVAGMGRPVLYISLEMRKEDVWPRIVVSRLYRLMLVESGFDYSCLRNTGAWIAKHPDCRGVELDDRNWFIDDRESLTIDTILQVIRKHHEDHKVHVVALDYINLVRLTGDRNQQSREEVVERLREIAKELKLCLIVVTQRSTEVSRRAQESKKQMTADVFYYTTLSHAAAVVVGIKYDDKTKLHTVEIPKGRFSNTGRREYRFYGGVQTFERQEGGGYYVPSDIGTGIEKVDEPVGLSGECTDRDAGIVGTVEGGHREQGEGHSEGESEDSEVGGKHDFW